MQLLNDAAKFFVRRSRASKNLLELLQLLLDLGMAGSGRRLHSGQRFVWIGRYLPLYEVTHQSTTIQSKVNDNTLRVLIKKQDLPN